jgi:hypothetical protein
MQGRKQQGLWSYGAPTSAGRTKQQHEVVPMKLHLPPCHVSQTDSHLTDPLVIPASTHRHLQATDSLMGLRSVGELFNSRKSGRKVFQSSGSCIVLNLHLTVSTTFSSIRKSHKETLGMVSHQQTHSSSWPLFLICHSPSHSLLFSLFYLSHQPMTEPTTTDPMTELTPDPRESGAFPTSSAHLLRCSRGRRTPGPLSVLSDDPLLALLGGLKTIPPTFTYYGSFAFRSVISP